MGSEMCIRDRLIKALLDKPTRWENFMPAVVAFALSLLIGWIF